jgi:hypothetical protein
MVVLRLVAAGATKALKYRRESIVITMVVLRVVAAGATEALKCRRESIVIVTVTTSATRHTATTRGMKM